MIQPGKHDYPTCTLQNAHMATRMQRGTTRLLECCTVTIRAVNIVAVNIVHKERFTK